MKALSLILICGFLTVGCASQPKEQQELRQPNQVTGDFGKTFLNASKSDTISDYFVSIVNNPKSDVYKAVDRIRTAQRDFGILQEDERIPMKITKKNFTVIIDSFEDYRGKVDADGNVIDAPYDIVSTTISIPVINRYYGGRIEVLNQLQFTCGWSTEKDSKNNRQCKLLKDVEMP